MKKSWEKIQNSDRKKNREESVHHLLNPIAESASTMSVNSARVDQGGVAGAYYLVSYNRVGLAGWGRMEEGKKEEMVVRKLLD